MTLKRIPGQDNTCQRRAAASRSPRSEKKNYLESSGCNNGSLRPASLIRHTIGDSIRKYQVREYEGTSGLWIERTATGKGVLANSDTGYPLRIRRQKILSYQSLRSFPSLLPLYRAHAISLPIYLSIGRDVREHESSVNACQVCRREINSHPRSAAFLTRFPTRRRPASLLLFLVASVGKINSRMSWRGRINRDC